MERRIKKNVKIAVVLNEKEAGICFPTSWDESDMSKMFYNSNTLFHEWCYDFFNEYWKDSEVFQESKLAKH